MRTVTRNAFLSGLCGIAVALGLMTASARADVTTERGASILAFPKVLFRGGIDTLISITNVSNSMVHARCFYVNAIDFGFGPIWQVTDFTIWLTKQQPTHWLVSEGRPINPFDSCIDPATGKIEPSVACADAGIDPGAIPPVPVDFEGELKCVEVDVAENPIGGNHLKGEAMLKNIDPRVVDRNSDVWKYNAIGILGTELAGETGNELLFNQPRGIEDVIGQYNACPNKLILNHFAEGVTDPVILEKGFGGPPQILDDDGVLAPHSVNLTELTLIPCSEDFENSIPSTVTVQFEIYNEFENLFSASATVTCWRDNFLFEYTSPLDPERSPFSFATLGSTVAQTRISPVNDPVDIARSDGGVLAVATVWRSDDRGRITRTALNVHMEGDRFTGTNDTVIDRIFLSNK